MNLTHINIVLGVLLAIVASLAVAVRVNHTQPNVEFLPEMKRSAAFDAFAANPVFANGRTLQAPVAGTIARGDLPLYYEATKEDAARAGEELRNPFTVENTSASGLAMSSDGRSEPSDVLSISATDEMPSADPQPDPKARRNASIQRGADVYGVFCVSCHGPSGAGDGPVTRRGFPPPPPLTTGKSVQMKDGQLFHILTYGQGSMSSMAAQLDRDRRWDVINYVRSMQEGAAASPTEPASDTTALLPREGQGGQRPDERAGEQVDEEAP